MEDAAIRARLATDERGVRRVVQAVTLDAPRDAYLALAGLRLSAERAARTLAACAADVGAYDSSRAELSESAVGISAEIVRLERELAEAQALRTRLDAWDAAALAISALPSVSASAQRARELDAEAEAHAQAEAAVGALIERSVQRIREAVASIGEVGAEASAEALRE